MGCLQVNTEVSMVRSIKKLLSLLAIIIGLTNSFAMPMSSRLAYKGSALSRTAAGVSIARRLLPNPVLKPGSLSIAPMPGIQANPTIFDVPQSKQRLEITRTPSLEPQVSEGPRVTAKKIMEQNAPKPAPRKVQAPKKQAQEIIAARPTKPAPRINSSSAFDVFARMRKQQAQMALDGLLESIKEPKIMQEPVDQFIVDRPVIQEPMDVMAAGEIIQPQSMQAVKARLVQNQSLQALNPAIALFNQLQSVQPQSPEYAVVHNELRNALLAAQEQGYSIGLVEKQLVEKMRGLPAGYNELFVGAPNAGAVIMPSRNMNNEIQGIAQAPFVIANILGLQGEFVPFIYKNNMAALGQIPDAAIEIVRAPINPNGPLQVDHSRIIFQAMPQLMAPADNAKAQADMRLVAQPDAGGMANGNNGNNNGKGPQLNAQYEKFNGKPHINRAQPHGNNGNNGNPFGRGGNAARALAGISNAEGQEEPVRVIEENPEILPIVPPLPEEPVHPEPKVVGEPRKIQREANLSPELWALYQYGNLILQALRARIFLKLQWAGQSQSLERMFIDYNALLARYREINDVSTNALYTDSNGRIQKVVLDVLDQLSGNKN